MHKSTSTIIAFVFLGPETVFRPKLKKKQWFYIKFHWIITFDGDASYKIMFAESLKNNGLHINSLGLHAANDLSYYQPIWLGPRFPIDLCHCLQQSIGTDT